MHSVSAYSLLVFLGAGSVGFGQSGASAPANVPTAGSSSDPSAANHVALPSDPAAFLELAERVNGLGADNTGGRHIKADFEILDDRGRVKEAGNYEEFWVSAKRYQVRYSSPSFSQTYWANESGTFAARNLKWPGAVEWMIRRSLFDLLPDRETAEKADLHWRSATSGIPLKCIDLIPKNKNRAAAGDGQSFCFDVGAPDLRYSSGHHGWNQGVYNDIGAIGDRYVAKDSRLMHGEKPYFHLRVTTLEAWHDSDGSLFLPSPGAAAIPARGLLDTDLRYVRTLKEQWSQLLRRTSGSEHLYPVVTQVLVGTDGRVLEARGVNGDPNAQVEAARVSRQWTFEPYVVNGQPREFYTELEFFF